MIYVETCGKQLAGVSRCSAVLGILYMHRLFNALLSPSALITGCSCEELAETPSEGSVPLIQRNSVVPRGDTGKYRL